MARYFFKIQPMNCLLGLKIMKIHVSGYAQIYLLASKWTKQKLRGCYKYGSLHLRYGQINLCFGLGILNGHIFDVLKPVGHNTKG